MLELLRAIITSMVTNYLFKKIARLESKVDKAKIKLRKLNQDALDEFEEKL